MTLFTPIISTKCPFPAPTYRMETSPLMPLCMLITETVDGISSHQQTIVLLSPQTTQQQPVDSTRPWSTCIQPRLAPGTNQIRHGN